MEYKAAIDYLFQQFPSFKKYGAKAVKYGLHNIKALCAALDNPQQQFKSIHIAGTNGKGSVAHILSAVFMAAGYKTGTFTSPHYVDFRERIKINGTYISKAAVVEFVSNNQNQFEKIKSSFFEITAAMAFWHFKQQQVDIAIIETGLGGRLDSTNIITPQLSVITNIGLDHQNMLGTTLTEIAGEKAGIIKQNIPAIIGEDQQKIRAVFTRKSKALDAPLIYANEVLSLEKANKKVVLKTNELKTSYRASYLKTNKQFEFETDLTASYQIKNLTTALAAIEIFIQYYEEPVIDQPILQQALQNVKTATKMLGKWMCLQNKPTVIADSAHNTSGINAILKNLNNHKFNNLHIVLGMMGDKDVEGVLKLLPGNAKYYFCCPHFRRALDANSLKQKAKHFNLFGAAYETVKAAKTKAIQNANTRDLVLITGSCFVVAEIL